MDFSKHSKIALQFSAGKDSAACLYLLEKHWDKITVVWGNPGNPYPETVEYMKRIRAMVPHFVEIRGGQPAWIKQMGYPVDIIPIANTPLGQMVSGATEVLMQPSSSCCSMNLWNPIAEYMQREGFTAIIRGQRAVDRLKAPLRDGMVIDGVEFHLPIEQWKDSDVLTFLGPERTPESYLRGIPHSLDCMNCTAYLSPERVRDLKLVDPAVHAEVKRVHLHLKTAMQKYGEML